MSNPSVLVILTNYRRPQNLPPIIQAWKGQSVPPTKIVVVDNSPFSGDEVYPANFAFEGGDLSPLDVWRIRDNLGPVCRFAPAFLLYPHYDYILFADDDVLPGSYGMETLLDITRLLDDSFSTLGSVGRWFKVDHPPGSRYEGARRNHSVTTSLLPQACDLTCSLHLLRSDSIPYLLLFSQEMWAVAQQTDTPLLSIHDDFLLCQGIQKATGYRSYLIPSNGLGVEYQPIKQRLDERGIDGSEVALWKRPSHWRERNRMVDLCLLTGWRSLV